MQVLSQGLCVSLCAEMSVVWHILDAGVVSEAVALCLTKTELFYWPSDSSSTEIRLLAVLLSVFSSQMQALSEGLWVLCAEMSVAWLIIGAGEVSEP